MEMPVNTYAFDSFRIDAAARTLSKDGNPIPLPGRVLDTLLVLVKSHPHPVGKDELIQAVWGGAYGSEDSLVQNISILRRALGDDPHQPRYIATVARHGYRFLAVPLPFDGDVPLPLPAPPVEAVPPRGYRRTAIAAALALAAMAALALTAGIRRSPAGEVSASRFQEQLPPGETLSDAAAISPDGRVLAYASRNAAGVSRIWVRRLDALEPRVLPGTEGSDTPFWSPDGAHLGFRTASAIKVVDLATGTVRVIAPLTVGQAFGASWGPGEVVLYANLGTIRSVAASGSQSKVIVNVAAGQLGEARWPVALPDGRHFLFYASGSIPERAGTYIGTFGQEDPVLLLPGYRAAFAPPDRLVYVRDRALVAQRFDADRRQLDGPPATIPGELSPGTRVSASGNSTLAISESSSAERLVWLDRRGRELDAIDVPRSVQRFWLSPDDRYALAVIDQAQVRELWLIDLLRKASTRIRDNATTPAWAPDSSRFLFTAIGATGTDFYLRTLAGPPDEALWLKTNDVKTVSSWSPDGQFVVFTRFTDPEQTAQDLWLLPTSGTHTPVPFIQTKARENGGQVSPDGRWIAYASDETGAYEVYAQAFPAAGAKVRISLNGGTQPIWRRNGRELFYLSADRQIMVTPLEGAQTLNPGPSTRLFPPAAGGMSTVDFAPASNGERFLVLSRRSEGRVSILMNWQAAQRP